MLCAVVSEPDSTMYIYERPGFFFLKTVRLVISQRWFVCTVQLLLVDVRP